MQLKAQNNKTIAVNYFVFPTFFSIIMKTTIKKKNYIFNAPIRYKQILEMFLNLKIKAVWPKTRCLPQIKKKITHQRKRLRRFAQILKLSFIFFIVFIRKIILDFQRRDIGLIVWVLLFDVIFKFYAGENVLAEQLWLTVFTQV